MLKTEQQSRTKNQLIVSVDASHVPLPVVTIPTMIIGASREQLVEIAKFDDASAEWRQRAIGCAFGDGL
jgi:hypothetical protein